MRALPLTGVRVVDLTHIWAGPKCTQILAELGAEVIKIEAPKRSDPARGITALLGEERYPGGERGTRPHNRSGYFNVTNRNKLGISLDLRHAAGAALFKRLVAQSHVVIENFSAGVMDRLELGYATLKEIRPDLVMVSMSGFGATGPDSHHVAYAITLEALAGIPAATGYAGGIPMQSFKSFSDPVSGLFGAAAVLVAVRHARQTGEGQYVDMSQLENLVSLNGPALMDASMNGRAQGPNGNRVRDRAPHGVYPCAGADEWVALDVADEAWPAFVCAIGSPAWSTAEQFSTVTGRLADADDLDRRVAEWTRQRSAASATEVMQSAGVACGPVLTTAGVTHDAHLRERGAFREIPHPEVGPYSYFVGMPARLRDLPLRESAAAPTFGEHNTHVLTQLLGLSIEDVERLEREATIASEPLENVAS
jgi:crotonobetainyl-CoA:carnitine CoA-transferase CaiB-like acyl-CoA transferase